MSRFDVAILLLLLWGIWKGYRRGFILQVIFLLGFVLAYYVAFRYFQELAPLLKEWIPYPFAEEEMERKPLWMHLLDTEMLYYSCLAFALLFFGTKISLYILARVLNLVALLPGLNMANRWLGVGLGFLEMFLLVSIVVQILYFLPWETGQEWLTESLFASWLTEESTFFSTLFNNIFK